MKLYTTASIIDDHTCRSDSDYVYTINELPPPVEVEVS